MNNTPKTDPIYRHQVEGDEQGYCEECGGFVPSSSTGYYRRDEWGTVYCSHKCASK